MALSWRMLARTPEAVKKRAYRHRLRDSKIVLKIEVSECEPAEALIAACSLPPALPLRREFRDATSRQPPYRGRKRCRAFAGTIVPPNVRARRGRVRERQRAPSVGRNEWCACVAPALGMGLMLALADDATLIAATAIPGVHGLRTPDIL